MSDKLKINKSYAENYNKWRQKEELAKLKDKYSGSVSSSDSEDDSSSESEDDDAEGLTEGMERDWMKTLAALKTKDPIIYQKDAHFYRDQDESSREEGERKKKKKDKPLYLKDYERKVITEKGGVISDESDEEPQMQRIGYYEEQDEIRKNLLAAAADSDDASDDGLIKTKHKGKTNQVESTSVQQKGESRKEETLKSYWNNRNLDDGEKFLRDYILGKKYIDKDEENNFMASDNEGEEGEGFSEEEELLVKQETFERKYNFRFEEPDADQIKSYPRNLEDTVRRKDTKRAEKRQKTKERKLKEKDLKKEELKQLKNLKKQEILNKIDKLREITGNKDLQFDEDELEKDFDPAEYDKMMQAQFGDEYYDEDGGEDVKPVFHDSGDEFDEGKWDDWRGQEDDAEYYEPHADDPEFNMDADYDPTAVPKKSKKKKKKNKLAQALEAKKPVYNPSEKTFEEYLDEYYKLDYEDIIDGMPCRFKYRKTVANDYGLSAEEVLSAREKELNAWASLKKMSQYRSEQEEMADVQVYTRKGKNFNKKKNILPSLYLPKEEKTQETSQDKGIKKNQKNPEETKDLENKSKNKPCATATVTSENLSKKDKKKKKKRRSLETGDVPVKKQKLDLDMTKEEEDEMESEKDSAVTSPDVAGEIKKKKHQKNKLQKSPVECNKTDESKLEQNETFTEGEIEERTSKTKVSTGSNEMSEVTVKKRKKRKKKRQNEEKKVKMTDERLKAYGINPKKYKYMSKEELFQFKNKDNE